MQDLAENSRTRVFELENGNRLIAKQTDPYGFWFLNLEKGQLPDRFQGAYSTWDALQDDVKRYQTLRDLVVAEVTPIAKVKR